MKYITNKELINKLSNIEDLYIYDLSNKNIFLIKKVINQFIDLIAVNDIDDNPKAPFEIPLNFMDNFEYDDLIAEIAETCTPETYSQLTAWLAYHNDHISLLDDYINNTEIDLTGFSIIYEISHTITDTLKKDLITIITNITK